VRPAARVAGEDLDGLGADAVAVASAPSTRPLPTFTWLPTGLRAAAVTVTGKA
jgi:hypothetical protein